MRYLIISDIHSNLEALERCLELTEGRYGRTLCLGDLVGYGPDPNAVIKRTRSIAEVIIRGNHDQACAGLTNADDFNPLARYATFWTRQQLAPENLAFLQRLPQGPVTLPGFELVHGSPLDEDEYIVGAQEAIPALENLATSVVFFGHTHQQGGFMVTPEGRFQQIVISPLETDDSPPDHGSRGGVQACALELEQGGRYLINPGSVGQPRDGDWRAGFAIFDNETLEVEYYRTPYNVAETQRKMRQAQLPDPLISRLRVGR